MTAGTELGDIQTVRNPKVVTTLAHLVHVLQSWIASMTIGTSQSALRMTIFAKFMRRAIVFFPILVATDAIGGLGDKCRSGHDCNPKQNQ
jgi:hypothetical protein